MNSSDENCNECELGRTIYAIDDKTTIKKKSDDADIEQSRKKDESYEAYCWQKAIKPLIYFCVISGLLVLCTFYCIPCLIGIFIFSACTCPFIPVMNLPLWSAMIILIYHGWALTTGRLSLTWG